jgi:hypothetical protein
MAQTRPVARTRRFVFIDLSGGNPTTRRGLAATGAGGDEAPDDRRAVRERMRFNLVTCGCSFFMTAQPSGPKRRS